MRVHAWDRVLEWSIVVIENVWVEARTFSHTWDGWSRGLDIRGKMVVKDCNTSQVQASIYMEAMK